MLVWRFQARYFWRWLAFSIWRSLLAFLLLLVFFVLLWGANYQREPIEQQFALQAPQTTEADLRVLIEHLTAIIIETAQAERDEARAVAAIAQAMQATVQASTGVMPNLPNAAKRLPQGSLILLGRASGVMSPWTLEPHVDGALPSVAYVAIAAHELAHVAAYAGEADADFISAVAGLSAADAYARYSVALRFWQDAWWQLPAGQRESYHDALPEIAQKDLVAMREPYQHYQMPRFIQEFQRRSYDSYLKTQGVKAGIKDYSRSLDLLIQAQKQGLIVTPLYR